MTTIKTMSEYELFASEFTPDLEKQFNFSKNEVNEAQNSEFTGGESVALARLASFVSNGL